MQTLSSVAPPPLAEEMEPITPDMPTFVPGRSERERLRMLGWAMVIGGATALALVLIVPKLRPAPAAQATAVRPPPTLPAPPQQKAKVQEAPSPSMESAQKAKKERRVKRATSAMPAEAKVTSVRVRARVAPVRATPDSDAKVVCSVKRGAVLRSLQQTPGSKGRWFGVHCDKDSPGWVHENFVSLRP